MDQGKTHVDKCLLNKICHREVHEISIRVFREDMCLRDMLHLMSVGTKGMNDIPNLRIEKNQAILAEVIVEFSCVWICQNNHRVLNLASLVVRLVICQA